MSPARARWAALLLGAALGAASPGASAGPAAGPNGGPTLSDPAELALWSAIFTKVQAEVSGWSAGGQGARGSLIDQRWCRPPVSPEACAAEGGLPDGPRSLGRARLGWMSTGRPNGDFGVHYTVLDLPEAGIGLRLSLSVGGRGLVGDQLSLRWQRAPAANGSPDLLRLGSSLQWSVGEQSIAVAMPGVSGPAEALAALAAGPGALQQRGLAHIDALERAVEAALSGDALRFCELGPYEGDGLPPACLPRPLTAAEKEAERARLRAALGPWRAALMGEAEALHAALSRWAP